MTTIERLSPCILTKSVFRPYPERFNVLATLTLMYLGKPAIARPTGTGKTEQDVIPETYLYSTFALVLVGLVVGSCVTINGRDYGPSRVSGLMMLLCNYMDLVINGQVAISPAVLLTYVQSMVCVWNS